MGYKVLIPTAGTGSRLFEMTKYLNKSLITIANKPAIARIIEMFPDDTEFVIPTGYKGSTVKEFLSLAYPERKFIFTDVTPFEGEGSGLGLSILTCREHLQEPFVFCSCDTLVTERIPEPDHNWIGFGEREDIKSYRTVSTSEGIALGLCEKGEDPGITIMPYIGLTGIYDFKKFWNLMQEGGATAIEQGESYALRFLMGNEMKAYHFTWFDTGTLNELEKTRQYFKQDDSPNILEKADETIWFMEKEVIKFSNNTKFISDRVKRAELLKGFVPGITGSTEHMYKYKYAEGEVLSKCVQIPIFEKLLKHSFKFWEIKELNVDDREKFYSDCMKFYKDKTYERVELFYKNFNKNDGTETINGKKMPTLKSMLDSLDWEEIAQGTASQFHGDFHFENILYDKNTDEFTFLDWRQNFGDSLEIGDIYYDFGKLMHGLIVCHDLIAKDEYYVNWYKNEINYDVNRKQILVKCEAYFYQWLDENKFDSLKVKLMTALIYLNIAALHHHPYGLMLYALGKEMLYEYLLGL